MKKYFLLTLLAINLFFIATNSFAFNELVTHPALTEAAAKQSDIGCDKCTYLQDNLGLKKGLDEVIVSDKIITILMNGSTYEDTGNRPWWQFCGRGLNHFYDPMNAGGLSDNIPLISPDVPYISNLKWATYETYGLPLSYLIPQFETDTHTNYYSWNAARGAFYFALQATNNTQRNQYFAYMFRSLGQVVHLLQDMAVPAHVRNDMCRKLGDVHK